MILAFYIIMGLYVLLIGSFSYGFKRLKEFKSTKNDLPAKFSVIIPFRNEADHLPQLIESLIKLDYHPQYFECLFVDDASEDSSIQIIHDTLKNSNLNFQILSNQRVSKSPKKDAITIAIQQAKFDWIITTDADCVVPPTWLQEFSNFSQQGDSEMIVGPVTYASVDYSFLEHFQILDFLSLQGATLGGFGIGRPFLCNGANLAYRKETFVQVNGFDGNNSIASGDDIFLFEKFLKIHPKKVHFLKSTAALVTTFPLKTWEEVVQQRIRWAAKSSSYNLLFAKLVAVIVFLSSVSQIVALIWFIIHLKYFEEIVILWLSKIAIDSTILHQTSLFYRGKHTKVRDLIPSSIIYPFFTVYVALKTLSSEYTWKGRSFRK